MSTQDTSIQQSALVTPIDGLSLPSANLVGQLTQFSTHNTAPVYRETVNQSSGPFLADTAENIQLFTDIFNSGKQLENNINGIAQDNTLETFLYSTLGVTKTVDVEAICAYVNEQTYEYGGKTYEFYVSAAALAEIENEGVRTSYLRSSRGDRYIGNYDDIKGQWVQLLAIINAINFGNSETTKDGTCFGKPGIQTKKNWYWAKECGPSPAGVDLHVISENTACKNNATASDIAAGYMKFEEPRTLYNLAISLDKKLTGITGLDATSPPSTLSVPLPVTDANIQSIFITASDANEFSSRSLDVRVNPDSIQVGPSDPTRLIKVFNTDKFNFTDDAVNVTERAPTVLQGLNLIDRKAEKNFALADSVESAVWSLGVGDWRNSQPDDPTITSQLTAAGYTDSGSQSLKRLNLIPVSIDDKVQVLSADDTGAPVLAVDPQSQVNLLEAVWTNWKNTVELNTDVYGISALNVPDLSATSFIADLSGKSIIENMNDMYLTLSACCNDEVDLSELPSLSGIYESLSALSAADDDMFTYIQQNDQNILNNTTKIDYLSGQMDLLGSTNTLNSDATELLQRVMTLSDQFNEVTTLSSTVSSIEAEIDEFDIDIEALETCCQDNKDSIGDLTLRLDNFDPTQLEAIKNVFDGIDFNTYVTRLSEVENSITQLGDIVNYVNTIETNTTQISGVSSMAEQNFTEIQNILSTLPSINTTELTQLVQTINNLTNIQTVLDDLSAGERFDNLENCCDSNSNNINNLTDTTNINTNNIQQITTNVVSLSDKIENPTGVVRTTTNQTVSGEKTLKSTLTVGASSYFEDVVTIGDADQPKIFDVCSTNGTTTVNIANLPVSSNGLNPGDLYVTEIDGKKILAIV